MTKQEKALRAKWTSRVMACDYHVSRSRKYAFEEDAYYGRTTMTNKYAKSSILK